MHTFTSQIRECEDTLCVPIMLGSPQDSLFFFPLKISSSIQSLYQFFSTSALYDCFLPFSLSLTGTVGFRDLSRPTRGGFAAGSSFSLMREMEPFVAYVHFSALCSCACVCVLSSVCMRWECLSVYVCGFCKIGCVKYYVCI